MMLKYADFKKWLDESDSINDGEIEHTVEGGRILLINTKHDHEVFVKGSDEIRLHEGGERVTKTSNSEGTCCVVTYTRTSKK